MLLTEFDVCAGRSDFGSLWELERTAGEGITGGNYYYKMIKRYTRGDNLWIYLYFRIFYPLKQCWVSRPYIHFRTIRIQPCINIIQFIYT